MRQTMRRVLVATDLSDTSPELMTTAASAAKKFGADLVAVHVFNPETYAKILGDTGMAIDQYVGYLQAEMRDHAAAAIGTVPVHLEVVEGRDIAQEILTAAARFAADLIVIGTHARTGLRRVLLGSVAEEVLRHATCPVLVVPSAAQAVIRMPAGAGAPAAERGREQT